MLRLGGVGNLRCANGFPLIAVQDDLAPELQHDEGQKVIRVIRALGGVVGD